MSSPDLSEFTDEELERIAASAGSEEGDLSSLSDEELEAIIGDFRPSDAYIVANQRERNIAETGGINPYSGQAVGGPEVGITNPTPEEEEALKSRAREVAGPVAALGTAPLTGGLSLLGAAGVGAASAGGARLGVGLATGEEPVEAVKGGLIEGGLAAAGEGVGRGFATLAGKAASRLSRGVTPPTAAGKEAADAIAAEGGLLTPALQSESRTAKILESIAESSILGSSRVSSTRTGAIEAAQKPLQRFLDAFGDISREEAGTVVQETIEGNLEAFQAATQAAYSGLDDLLKARLPARAATDALGTPIGGAPAVEAGSDAVVSLLPIKNLAGKIAKESEAGLSGGELSGILRQVRSKPNAVSFASAAKLRSDLLRITRASTELIGGQTQAAAKRLAGNLDEIIERTAKDAGDEIYDAFRNANAIYKQGAEVFNSKLIKGLSTQRPEAIVSAIAKSKKPGTIRAVRQALNNPEAFRKVQGAFLKDLFDSSFEASGDIARGTFLSGKKILTKLQNFGDDAAKELLGAEQLAKFRKLAQVLERAQQRTGSGLSGLNIRGGIEGYALGVGNFYLSLAPAALGRALTNPRFVELLTRGFQVSPGSKEAATLLSRMTSILAALEASDSATPSSPERRQEPTSQRSQP